MEICTTKPSDICAEGFCEGCPQPEGKFPESTPIAMAYVPYQKWEQTYDVNIAIA